MFVILDFGPGLRVRSCRFIRITEDAVICRKVMKWWTLSVALVCACVGLMACETGDDANIPEGFRA